MRRLLIGCLCACFVILAASNGSPQEKTIVSHTTRGSLSIGPLPYGIDEAKAVANVTKPVSHTDVVDYSFVREAIKQK